MSLYDELNKQIQETVDLPIDKQNELKDLCSNYVKLKWLKVNVMKQLDEAMKEKSSIEKRIIDLLEAQNKISQATSESMITIKYKEYVTVPKEKDDKKELFNFLGEKGKDDMINVNSQTLNRLNKEFQKEIAPDDPNWVMPGLGPKVVIKSLSITKL